MDWKLYSFIVRSKQRKEILRSLETPKTPTQIGSKLDISISHVSRTLKNFVERGIVDCLTPQEKIGRIYKLTSKGEEILDKIKNDGI